jgi:hypothetical protein
MIHKRSYFFLLLILTCAFPCLSANDSLYFLYQRSTYLENLTMWGAWWANPATISEITEKTAMSTNVTPLGNVFTLASARYMAPFEKYFSWGIGILGAGINRSPDGSLLANNAGAQYQSHVTLSNPSIQVAAGAKLPGDLEVGLLGDIGTEVLPDGYGSQSNFLTMGAGLGIMTPYLFDKVSLTLSSMSRRHLSLQPYMDYDGKAGLRFKASDSLYIGSLEYTFSMGSGYYQVVKGIVSIKALSVVGVLAGFSQDVEMFSDNGAMIHVGVELRRSSMYPFFGGYEIGIAVSNKNRDILIHQLWIGYCFGRPSKIPT